MIAVVLLLLASPLLELGNAQEATCSDGVRLIGQLIRTVDVWKGKSL